MDATQIKPKRPTCQTCSKPTRVCICTRIRYPAYDNKVHVTILQHSRETNHPLNSSRIAKLGLKNVTIKTVSDDNLGSQIEVRLMEPGQHRPPCESPILHQDLERVNLHCQSEISCGFMGREIVKSSKEVSSCNSYVKDSVLISNCSDFEVDDKLNSNGVISANGEEPVITAQMGKYGMIADLDCVWIGRNDWKKRPSFDQIMGSEAAINALSEGFVVKKSRKEMLKGRLVEESTDFELPCGSVLLFPCEKALNVDELKEMGLEVTNLIVLDGTWRKAGRIYEDNPWLRLLPHLKLESGKRSLYREIRCQPKAGYLSTIESIVNALKAVSDMREELDNLLDVFDSMVLDQRRLKEQRLSRALS